ncbi:ribosomal protein S18-alanine N-acetyltransferase [Yersinia massiliensis]|uniref:[Ribosomal protein bS18]-alanine N-acetyltransferase n=1 Tax=Yersinia massiliensis TaxID=419257 RepID=A0A2R4NU53_9GAMM|nr:MULTISPECIES: ribosomal protein S18-alanine N-acetyltransferase [Yersinia]HEC1651053.1 ribosomal protein S18-alanine N-acetyltransferase [Yersinia enterocolitica]AVX39608.1 ribosomal-protein-alanine N-acetyltransferase RimI [Yersinia massiliensis]MDA5548230.1 ribosomal protein S18-alanine N-acetyltransferase [Yersinia massiliensis]NIL26840.1 ribosomal protein S18-alanine N-acetyltransferase [Yersinia massiliensis]OWF74304.1 ribosomal-protein-alanine N-acetyltransferase RimI [Yersinia freder
MKQISILTPADLATAYQIEQASHAFPWSEKTLASNQGERYLNFKLSVEQQMVGFAITQTVLDEATLFNIAIDPQHQRRGYGRLLLEHLIAQLESRGIVTLWLEVRASNAGAIALYESLGFNEVSVRRNYYPSANGREDAIMMALPLG